MAPDYRHVETGRVIGVREDSMVARLVEADAGYELVTDEQPETFIPDGENERAREILTETLARLADTERQLAEARARLDAEPVAVTDPPSPIGEDGIPVLTDPEQTESETVDQTDLDEEVDTDAGIGDGRRATPRKRTRRGGTVEG